MLPDLELMEHHVNVLFKHDSENRMTVVNEPPYEAAPRIFIGGTKLGNVRRYSNCLEPQFVKELERTLEINTDTPLAELINVLTHIQPLKHIWIGPAYVFPDIREQPSPKVTQVTNTNKELLKPLFPYTFEDFEYKQPCFAIVENHMAVSICCSARQTALAAEASIYTHENYRGRGYAVNVTKTWAAEVQKQGRMALYSTSWDNFSSQAVARKLQLVQYGTDIHME